MKELSIEEKARRYDGAIEELRGMMPNWKRLSYNGKTFLQDLVHIFPELKKSEDERIRKALMQNLQERFGTKGNMGEGLDMPDVLAWLEKQGDKTAWSEDDELHIRELESLVKQAWATAEHENDKETIHKMSDLAFFLKTLRPQTTWKPSDEQMEALDDFIYAKYPNIEKHGASVKLLYQDLKKLKGE